MAGHVEDVVYLWVVHGSDLFLLLRRAGHVLLQSPQSRRVGGERARLDELRRSRRYATVPQLMSHFEVDN